MLRSLSDGIQQMAGMFELQVARNIFRAIYLEDWAEIATTYLMYVEANKS